MAKKKRMTNKEKQERAAIKKRLQEEGILPPDKERLNRKKYIEEAKEEWKGRDDCLIWDVYLLQAVFQMMRHVDHNGRISPEAVGAAKVLKIAISFQKYDAEIKEKGKRQNGADELYRCISGIMDA